MGMRDRILLPTFSRLFAISRQSELPPSSFHGGQHWRGFCDGAPPSGAHLQDAIKLSHIITQPGWNPSHSCPVNFHLTPHIVAELIDLHSDPVLALRLFIWASRQRGYRHSSVSRHALSQLWRHKQDFPAFMDTMECMEKSGAVLSPAQDLLLIKAYGWAHMAEDALAAFQRIRQQVRKLSAFHFNAILHVLVKEGRMKQMRLVHEQMEAARIRPSLVTYTIRIQAFCQMQQSEEAFKLFFQMTNKGLCPGVSTFGRLIDAVCRMDRVQKVYQMLYNLLQACSDLDPAYYHTLIDRLCRNEQVELAQSLVVQLQKRNVYPSSEVYNFLAFGFCRVNRVHEAGQTVKEMMKHGEIPDLRTVNHIISLLLEQQKVTEALKLLDRVTDVGFIVNISTYDILVQGLCKCKQLHKALEIWNTLRKAYVPNVESSCILIERLCWIRNFSKAQFVLSKMVEADCSNDILQNGFKILHSSLRAAGKFDEAKSALRMIKEQRKVKLEQKEAVAIPEGSVS